MSQRPSGPQRFMSGTFLVLALLIILSMVFQLCAPGAAPVGS